MTTFREEDVPAASDFATARAKPNRSPARKGGLPEEPYAGLGERSFFMKPLLTLLAVLPLAPVTALHAADLVLVAKDTPAAPIVVFTDAPPRTRDAAVTLAEYIEKISGARPDIVDGQPSPLPERAVWGAFSPS